MVSGSQAHSRPYREETSLMSIASMLKSKQARPTTATDTPALPDLPSTPPTNQSPAQVWIKKFAPPMAFLQSPVARMLAKQMGGDTEKLVHFIELVDHDPEGLHMLMVQFSVELGEVLHADAIALNRAHAGAEPVQGGPNRDFRDDGGGQDLAGGYPALGMADALSGGQSPDYRQQAPLPRPVVAVRTGGGAALSQMGAESTRLPAGFVSDSPGWELPTFPDDGLPQEQAGDRPGTEGTLA